MSPIQPYKGTLEIDGNHVEWETTFDQSVKFKCTNCGYCCDSSNVILSFEDFPNIPVEFQELREDSKTYIKGTDHSRCPFLSQDNLCNIYEKRPYVCREYPFKVTFVSNNKAYIDLIHACESIVKEDYLPDNEVDFSFLVRKSYYKQLLAEKPSLNFDFLSDEEIKRILSEPCDWQELKHKLFELLKQTSQKPYKTMDLYTNKFYFIIAKGNNIIASDKEIDINTLNNKLLTDESKFMLYSYISMLFTRKLTQLDFANSMQTLNEHSIKLSDKELQKRAINRLYLTMLFFLNIIAEKNAHNSITSLDVKEAIFLLDTTFLAPMEGIIGPLLKKN